MWYQGELSIGDIVLWFVVSDGGVLQGRSVPSYVVPLFLGGIWVDTISPNFVDLASSPPFSVQIVVSCCSMLWRGS